MDYKISVIIPVYRVERYIARCCKSLFEMQFNDVEFLFVDDATPDNSITIVENVLKGYSQRKEHVKIIRHERNKGVACARNTGLNAATGKYIAFVDADDWIETDMFKKLYEKAETNDLDIVGCDWYMEFGNSNRYIKQPVYEKTEDCLCAMLSGEMRWFLWAFIVKRNLYVEYQIHFIDGVNIGEDMAVLIQCFGVAKTYSHISEALYHYVKSNVISMTSIDAKKQIKIVKSNVDVVVNFIKGRYENRFNQELDFFKLTVKFPLLITDDAVSYDLWNSYFPESEYAIWKNKKQPFRNRLLQWAASHRYYWIVKSYHYMVFKFMYRLLYR